ncbi:hypothetical protein GCM10009007_09700 [Formosimonas limnophila]|uniref:Uncharacterized protein n=1 Tax=Formosimonas limnophila TaxID=1384487 RepID=A0A8J3CH02_9BURK|nr:hypothetical protein [Formosimonas limnophila]GHA70906.1 hypothetical protein GCM10009007_09700 [Formosimonas limnophila]
MRKTLSIILFSLALIGCSKEDPSVKQSKIIIDIPMIASKSLTEVEKAIGSHIQCQNSNKGHHCLFSQGAVEITFVEDKANLISLTSLQGKQFSKEVLELLGLPSTQPSFKDATTAKWEDIAGYSAITMSLEQNNQISSIYIEVQ